MAHLIREYKKKDQFPAIASSVRSLIKGCESLKRSGSYGIHVNVHVHHLLTLIIDMQYNSQLLDSTAQVHVHIHVHVLYM